MHELMLILLTQALTEADILFISATIDRAALNRVCYLINAMPIVVCIIGQCFMLLNYAESFIRISYLFKYTVLHKYLLY